MQFIDIFFVVKIEKPMTNGSMADENKESLVEQVPPTSWEDGSLGNEPTWVGQPTVKQHGRCEQ